MATGIKKANCNLPEIDVFDNNWNNEICVYEDLRKNYKNYFNNLSYLVGYLDKLNQNEAEFRSFYDSLMHVARVDSTTVGRLETADLRTLSTLLHYMESLFAAYDVDRNRFLSASEIRATYPKFKLFAEKFANQTASEKLQAFDSWKGITGYGCYTKEDLIHC